MRKGARRAAFTVLALVAGTVALDAVLGLTLTDTLDGRPLPPFGMLDGAKHRETLARDLREERARAGAPAGGVHVWDAELGWDYRPGEWEADGTTYRINALGARGARDVTAAPPAGLQRVLCFGDSFTFGTEVAGGEDWPNRLDREHEQLEVLNFGVGGYGLDQSLLRFRRTAPDLDADVVLIGFQLQCIHRNVNRYVPLLDPWTMRPAAKPRFLFRDGELELLPLPYATRLEFLEAVADGSARRDLSEWDYWAGDDPLLRRSSLCRLFAARRAWKRRQPFAIWRRGTREPVHLTVELADAFTREARALGCREAVVLIFPSYGDVGYYRDSDGRRYWDPLGRALEGRGIRYLDLTIPLADHAPDELYTPGRVHLNAKGNAAVAAAVGPLLERLLEKR